MTNEDQQALTLSKRPRRRRFGDAMAARRQVAGVAAVIAQGDHRASLEALRDHLARELENAPAGIAIGPIANQLRLVLAELDALPVAKGVSTVDELAGKRAARRAAAAGQ